MTQRRSYPRINCCIAGCKRGTTRMAPREDGSAPEIICSKHWRTVPKSWRSAMAFLRRVAVAAEKKGDEERYSQAARAWWRGWRRIVSMLSNPETVMDGEVPATLSTQLKAVGLL